MQGAPGLECFHLESQVVERRGKRASDLNLLEKYRGAEALDVS